MNIGKLLSTLRAVFLGGMLMLAVVACSVVYTIRNEVLRLSQETSPMQVNLAKLQRGFERVSGDFSRISSAVSEPELAGVERDAAETMREIERIAEELAHRDSGIDTHALEVVRKAQEELRAMARERLASHRGIARANQAVSAEIEAMGGIARDLSQTMGQLQKASQEVLFSSKKASQDANAGIKRMLVLREKTEEIRSCVQDVRLVDKKFRLNVLKDKAKSILDAMAAQEVADPALSAQVKMFAEKTGAAFEGPAGVVAARAAQLASPEDAKAKADFDDKNKQISSSIDALSTHLLELIDPLEFSVSKGNQAMNDAAGLIRDVATISGATAEANAHARTLQALAWQLLAANDVAAVDQIRAAVVSSYEQLQRSLGEIRQGLTALKRPKEVASVATAVQGFTKVKDLLAGESGVASVVRHGLEKQAEGEKLFANASRSIQQIALAGSSRAHDAEGAEVAAVERIRRLSTATFLLLGVIATLAIGVGGVVSGRIRNSILRAGRQEREAARRTLNIVRQVKKNTAELRATSNQLSRTSSQVTDHVESMAASAGQLEGSMQRIAESASQAAEVGSKAGDLADGATRAIQDLSRTSAKIGEVTQVIQTISIRTNLLALNAAIEAATAGAVGAGFGVVADKVKDLASECSSASTDIRGRIETIQKEVTLVNGDMGRISAIVGDVRAMQQTIVAAVREQRVATEKIGRNIRETADECRGSKTTTGVSAMAEQLARMAAELEQLCETAAVEEDA